MSLLTLICQTTQSNCWDSKPNEVFINSFNAELDLSIIDEKVAHIDNGMKSSHGMASDVDQ